jgi:hypothetical protein
MSTAWHAAVVDEYCRDGSCSAAMLLHKQLQLQSITCIDDTMFCSTTVVWFIQQVVIDY